jgi:hypothetical protein
VAGDSDVKWDDSRHFLLDYVEKVTHVKDKVSLHGRVPIKHTRNDVEINELAFCIEAAITRERQQPVTVVNVDAEPTASSFHARQPVRNRFVKCHISPVSLGEKVGDPLQLGHMWGPQTWIRGRVLRGADQR